MTWAVLGVLLAPGVASSAAAPSQADSGPQLKAPTRRSTIAVRTPPGHAWPQAVEAIAFELDQAGYRIVPDGVQPGATVTVSHDAHRWRLVLLDTAQNLVLEATGYDGESAQMLGLHAVELLHASRLDVPKHRQQQPAAPPRPEPTTARTEPVPGPRPPKPWVLDVGLGVSSVGLLGPRLGFARHWQRVELGAALEGGFGNAGNIDYPASRDDWFLGRPRAVVRSTLEFAYVSRPGRRLRPLVGVSSELVAPIVASTHAARDPDSGFDIVLDTVEVGVLWAPGVDVGTRVALGPRLALRAALRVGPLVSLHPVDLADGGTFRLPRGAATATVSFLFGSTAER